VMRHELGEH